MAAPGPPAIAGWSPPIVAMGTELITVVVGLERKTFGAHKNLLCASSKYFDSALNGGFLESESKEVKLFAIDPVVFEFFYRWLYSPPRGVDDPLYQQARDSVLQPDLLLLNLYLLGDYLLCPGFKLLAIEQLRALFSYYDPAIPSHEFLCFLFNADHLQPLQMYIIKHIGFWISKSEDRDEWVELIKTHRAVALDMAVEFASLETIHKDALKVVHPSKVTHSEIELGLNREVLAVQARANDAQPTHPPDEKVLGEPFNPTMKSWASN